LRTSQLAEISTKATNGERGVTTKLCGPALEMKSQGYYLKSKLGREYEK
jgi:hypothetical protein